MMRTTQLLAALATAALVTAGSFGTAVAGPPDSPYAGTWIGNDLPPPGGDGSNVVLTVGGGPAPIVVLEDDAASVCGGATLEPGVFEGRGRYNRVRETLTVNFTRNSCVNGTRVGPLTGIVYTFVDGVLVGGGATFPTP